MTKMRDNKEVTKNNNLPFIFLIGKKPLNKIADKMKQRYKIVYNLIKFIYINTIYTYMYIFIYKYMYVQFMYNSFKKIFTRAVKIMLKKNEK